MIVATAAGLFSLDGLMAEIEHLTQLATVVINEHTDDEGLCSVCVGVAFPCASVALAAHNVAFGGGPHSAEPETVSGGGGH